MKELDIKRIVISDEEVTLDGITLPLEKAMHWRLKMFEENEIWNGRLGTPVVPEQPLTLDLVPEHLKRKEVTVFEEVKV